MMGWPRLSAVSSLGSRNVDLSSSTSLRPPNLTKTAFHVRRRIWMRVSQRTCGLGQGCGVYLM